MFGANSIGLKRRGFSAGDHRRAAQSFPLADAQSGLNTTQALERIAAEVEPTAEVKNCSRSSAPPNAASSSRCRYGLIAGNGRFPVLALEAARKAGIEIVAIGIKEEASPEIEPWPRAALDLARASSAS